MHELLGRANLRRVDFIMGFWSQHHASLGNEPDLLADIAMGLFIHGYDRLSTLTT